MYARQFHVDLISFSAIECTREYQFDFYWVNTYTFTYPNLSSHKIFYIVCRSVCKYKIIVYFMKKKTTATTTVIFLSMSLGHDFHPTFAMWSEKFSRSDKHSVFYGFSHLPGGQKFNNVHGRTEPSTHSTSEWILISFSTDKIRLNGYVWRANTKIRTCMM